METIRWGVLGTACIACGQCEGLCPQHLPSIELLREASVKLDT